MSINIRKTNKIKLKCECGAFKYLRVYLAPAGTNSLPTTITTTKCLNTRFIDGGRTAK